MIDITSLSSPVMPLTVPIQAVAPIPSKGNWLVVVLIMMVVGLLIWGIFYTNNNRNEQPNGRDNIYKL